MNLLPNSIIYNELAASLELAKKIHHTKKSDNNTVYGLGNIDYSKDNGNSYTLCRSLESSLEKLVSSDFKRAYTHYWHEDNNKVFPIYEWKVYHKLSVEELLTILESCKKEHLDHLLEEALTYHVKGDNLSHIFSVILEPTRNNTLLKEHDLTQKLLCHKVFSILENQIIKNSLVEFNKQNYEAVYYFLLWESLSSNQDIDVQETSHIYAQKLCNRKDLHQFYDNVLGHYNYYRIAGSIEDTLDKTLKKYIDSNNNNQLVNKIFDYAFSHYFKSQPTKEKSAHQLFYQNFEHSYRKILFNNMQHDILDKNAHNEKKNKI